MAEPERFRLCSTCRKEIPFQGVYFVCSVSTCNRARIGLFFCSVACWDAHLGEVRHREAWAEERRAPTREEWAREQAGEAPPDAPRRVIVAPPTTAPAAPAPSADVPREVLVVVSKLKAYVRARSGMNTSDGVVDVLSDHLRRLCELAAKHAAEDGRKTVMDRDFQAILR
jgi:hypothetical protein